MNYNKMVSAIYAGQAIGRLKLLRNNTVYNIKDIAMALGCKEDQESTIRGLLRDRGYSAKETGDGGCYSFTYVEAVAAIKNVALPILRHNEP